MATEQAEYALVSYKRLIENDTLLFDMRDVDVSDMDIDLSGDVNIDDATLLQKYIAGITELNLTQLRISDTNGDDSIDIDDVTTIQKAVAGMI